ncbi:MAG TPA: serine hydrolase domain-containing protein [Bryobacteraceae bacterium]|nr:serine hydrolase domain-containing protein [Bryobacteraceae bacterium]
MRPDTIFQMMSMTKPFVGTSIMMLAEEGKLAVTDTVEKHIPEFRGQMVVVKKNEDGTVLMKKPARPITIFDVMTHSSGMSYGPPAGLKELEQKMDRTLADAMLVYSQMPLEFEPGSKWQYSNLGIAILGRIIELRSGMPFEKFLETRLFQPLGMKDSHIFLPAEKHLRLATLYRKLPDGMEKMNSQTLGGDSLNYRKGAKYSAPEWGLYSTAQDLAAFYQMLLNGGVANGKRFLSKASIATMTRKQTGNLRAGHMPNTAFGLTWEVVEDPRGQLNYLSVGSFGHGGAFGTHGWVDPKKDMVGVYLVQMSGADVSAKYGFMQMANAAVLDFGEN